MDDGDKKKIIIVGGGLAGISAALAALERGWIPLVFEKNDSLGGRVRSFRLNGIGTFDNGQHVLSGCYTHTKWLLNQINSTPLVKFQKRLEIFFLLSAGRSVHFRTWNLPAPFHLLMPLWLKMPLTSEDRSFLLRWGRDFYRLSETQLKSCSVQEWLKMYGRTNLLTPILWSPLALATMNTPLEQASALLFYRILKLAFLAGVQESGLGIPQAFLNELFVAPAYSKILENGGKIFTRHRITKLRVEDGRINMLITASGK
ncbi:MAG: FAD-dependent oxidoreductase, partial [Calditrichaeota bacterium]